MSVTTSGGLGFCAVRDMGQPPVVRFSVQGAAIGEVRGDITPAIARKLAADLLRAADEADRMTAALETKP